MDKTQIIERQEQIIQFTKSFCDEKLDEDYAELTKKLILKLGRKKNVPFATGQVSIWAAAIIHALGTINFLFDKSFEPYVSVDDINDFFGTKKSTTGNKSKEIRELLNLGYFDEEFSTKQVKNNNPFNNLIMKNGFIIIKE
jgi:hypothetical protein